MGADALIGVQLSSSFNRGLIKGSIPGLIRRAQSYLRETNIPFIIPEFPADIDGKDGGSNIYWQAAIFKVGDDVRQVGFRHCACTVLRQDLLNLR